MLGARHIGGVAQNRDLGLFSRAVTKGAEARAIADVERTCAERKGLLKSKAEITDTHCVRIDGWVSTYVCGASASGICQRVVGDTGSN